MNTNTPSFEDIVRDLHMPLLNYLKRMTGNSVDADDLLQETFMRIAHGLPKFEHHSSIKNWAFKIATNTAIDFFRKSKKAKFIELTDTDEVVEFDKDDAIILDEMNKCIRQTIDTFSPEYRAPLILTNFEGKSVAETAKICGISIAAAKVRIHRAKTFLKKKLNKKCDFYTNKSGNIRCDRKEAFHVK